MAQLDDPRFAPTAAEIPATTQLLAIAWLRWRMFVNNFHRRQGGPRKVGALILTILLRLLLWPIFAMMAIGPAFAAGFFAWSAVSKHHPQQLTALLAGIALLWQFVAINGVSIAATISSFDPSSLLRFPLRFGRYLVLRLLLGLLTPSTIIGCLTLFASAVGIAIANLALAPAAAVVLAIYAAMNLFISRMIAAWVERWLATRRAREIFGGMMALFFVSFQFINYHRVGPRPHPANSSWLLNFMRGSNHFLIWLPPGFASSSILLAGHPLVRLAQFVALLASTALFLAAFAFRLHKQFLGEYLSEGAPRTHTASVARLIAIPHSSATLAPTQPGSRLISPGVAACLRKEWVYLRGNVGQLVGMLTPLIFVVIFSRGLLAQHPSFLISGAVGYALMGPLAALYNIFGADGAGVQLYLLAPLRLRDVVLAKNLVSLGLLTVQATLAWIVVRLISVDPILLPIQVSTAFWIVFLLFVNLTLGTLRSIQSPRKVVPGQARKLRTQPASKTSGLLVLAILFASILIQLPVRLVSRHLDLPWLAVWVFVPLAAAAIAAYALLLHNADRLILKHRDLFAEELYGD